MATLKPLIPTKPQIFSTSSLRYVNNPIKICITNYPSIRRSNFKFPLKSSRLPLNFPLQSSRNSRVSACCNRPTSRRKNYLRKKLIEQQVSQIPAVDSDPILKFDDIDDFVSKMGNLKVFDSVDASTSGNIQDQVLEFDDINDSLSNLDDFHSVEVSKSRNLQNTAHEFDDNDKVMLNQLKSWVDQYEADTEFWGTGSSPIFTIFRDSDGKVKKVDIDEDEILRRSQIEPSMYKLEAVEDVKEVNSKISHAKFLAKEMEKGKNVLPANSSVAKFVNSSENLDFRDTVQGFACNPGLVLGNDVLPTNSSVEKFVNSSEKLGFLDTIRGFACNPGLVPKLSKVGIAVFFGFLVLFTLKSLFASRKKEEDYSSLEKEMLRRKVKARMVKEKLVKGSVEVVQDPKEPEIVFVERPRLDKEELMKTIVNINASNGDSVDINRKIQEIRVMARHARETERTDALVSNNTSSNKNSEIVRNRASDPQGDAIGTLNGTTRADEGKIENSDGLKLDVPKDDACVAQVVQNKRSNILDTEKVPKNTARAKPRIIMSVEEAREYLSKKQHEKQEKAQEAEVTKSQEVAMDPKLTSERSNSGSNEGENFSLSSNGTVSRNVFSYDAALRESGDVMSKNVSPEDDKAEHGKGGDGKGGELGKLNRQKWMEDNFQEFEPIVEKIRAGFRDNYMVARKEVKEDLNIISELKLPDEGDELEWLKDERLRDIVFQVRENELMGRDPFYLMDPEDRSLFFEGLEKKVEKENEKLRDLHQYLHSNIENLDYGADGISVYDPPEKIIPRWKGPPPTTAATPEFLDDYMQQREALFAETFRNSSLVKKDPEDLLHNVNQKAKSGNLKSLKTVIEGSDGSVKPGKKSGKEFWQHTKKWSRGFLECYNAETDPETKDMMKDIGKDLDRWLTEKEIQEAADIMDKVPKKRKKFINERLNKVKREMELFGPHAVVNKYSEYAEEEEVDYYWWLDLPCVLCIELYMDGDGDGDGERNIGFYSLEMAADLELDPKPHHVIAFEDTGDCKNFCYIVQAHLEMLGKGNAFIVPQSPKDAYREAKANGFNVTVIRKGAMKLNVDQTLEEVEEQITEIGSKMYHDQLMKGRSVGMESLMKGVFGPEKSTKRRSKKLKKPTK